MISPVCTCRLAAYQDGLSCRDIRRYLLQEFHGHFSADAEMKLAMTIWGGSTVHLVQPEYFLQNLPSADSQAGRDH